MASAVPINRTTRLPVDLAKALPINAEAERSILGAVLLDNPGGLKAITETGIRGEDFFDERHRRILRRMLDLSAHKRAIDLVTLTDDLARVGELDAAGGAPYVTSLADGMPRVTNAKHYCEIVIEKSQLRELIHYTHALQSDAFSGQRSAKTLHEDMELFMRSLKRTGAGHHPVTLEDLLAMTLPERQFAIYPILPERGIGMIYSWRGSGKTFFTMEIAYCVAAGISDCFTWTIPQQRYVLYVDGEMDSTELQLRARQIAIGHDMTVPKEKDFLRFITPDLEDHTPEILTAEGRRRIEDQLRGGELIIFDNLSTLIPTGDERETEDWAVVQEWFLSLRRRGFTTLFNHHAGKGGGQRGTSNREDVLNLVINLRRPADYSAEDGLRAEVFFEKIRGRAQGAAVQPFEVKLQTDEHNRAVWTRRPLKTIINRRAFEMFGVGMKDREIAEDLHLSRFQVYRLRKKYEVNPDPASLDED
jgi:KaiC/GvpD/RAD55 family RecA-like ATPase